eukprot:TRINITY_DN615_c0_g1_i1.p5 TRINITY_DN615_c0_g1~~TRINITY_DN615_c0_g1_i1.p5  ORF type:complete len:137 (-),score=7.24 TRINITY_DN615_c0_g1_i1:323-733(-)
MIAVTPAIIGPKDLHLPEIRAIEMANKAAVRVCGCGKHISTTIKGFVQYNKSYRQCTLEITIEYFESGRLVQKYRNARSAKKANRICTTYCVYCQLMMEEGKENHGYKMEVQSQRFVGEIDSKLEIMIERIRLQCI